ncbi:hypothetical protein PLICRDRAFT_700534 [Plicaturopsis crispa FD-325 SS-3]|nr:hypothetical protein PLICRDRAFT_700534 [Plicaturopsis crispa FD-325 SS-3]
MKTSIKNMPKVSEGPLDRMNYFTRPPPTTPSAQERTEAKWRCSRVGVKTKITQTSALRQYKLQKSDLKGLERQDAETVVRGINEDELGPMYLYTECDVERVAWRKRGGPERFDAFLKKLRRAWAEKKRVDPETKPFDQPCSYTEEHNSSPWHACSGVPSEKRLHDLWVATPDLFRLKMTFAPWMWQACNRALKDVPEYTSYSNKERHTALGLVEANLGRYPPRPVVPLPPSPSLDALRAVLERAPCSQGVADDKPPPGITYCHRNEKEVVHLWNSLYLEELFSALVDVIQHHGVEDAGWCSARWEVYDKLATCILDRGMLFSRYGERGRVPTRWYDDARVWLRGRLEPSDRNHQIMRGDARCEAGTRYNALLPEQPNAAA